MLRPDILLANEEENRRKDVDSLRAAGIPVWVTVIETVDQALESLRRVFADALGWPEPAWLCEARAEWAAPPPATSMRVVIPIWRDPWMVVGSPTFTGDLANRTGWSNVFENSEKRYPHVTVEQILESKPELVVLPDEPYPVQRRGRPRCLSRTGSHPGRRPPAHLVRPVARPRPSIAGAPPVGERTGSRDRRRLPDQAVPDARPSPLSSMGLRIRPRHSRARS